MPDSGAGVYSLPGASFPYVTGQIVDATKQNANANDIASAMTNRICKDGQTTITANIPFGGNKITGLLNGTAATDAATFSQARNQDTPLISVSIGTAQNITNSTDTLILYDTVGADTSTAYTAATGRFFPLVAGYYQIIVSPRLIGNTIAVASVAIRKNGVTMATIETIGATFNTAPTLNGSLLVALNGTTDYVDSTAFITAAASWQVGTGSFMQAVFVRGL